MPKKIRDQKTYRKIKKHLSDSNDKITEGDIKNAIVDFENIGKKQGQEETDDIIKDNTDPGIQTTWNILE